MIKRKVSIILLFVMAFQWPVCAITQNQAYLGSALFAVGGALLTGKSENPPFILAASALAGAAGYFLYFRKLTPSFRMNKANAILDTLSNNELAKGYIEIVDNIRKNLKNDNTANEKTKEFDIAIITKITMLYPSVPNQQPYPLVTAMNGLDEANNKLKQVDDLLKNVRSDIDDTTNNDSWNRYDVLNRRLQPYDNSVKAALTGIALLEEYQNQLKEFNNWQTQQQQLKIDQQQADAATLAAQAAQRSANALQQQANAVRSSNRREWMKAWLMWLFGMKSN